VPFTPDSLPLGPGVLVLNHHPAGVLALDKPPGILSHPNGPEDARRSLLSAPYDSSRESYLLPGGSELHLIHRLDSPTSGVILLAASIPLATELRLRFLTREVEKTYLALVFGVPRRRQDLWQDRLHVKRAGDRLRAASSSGGDSAACAMRHLQTFTGVPVMSLLELSPLTGRTHQLRVQCQKRGLPIVGDSTYGDFSKNRSFAQKTGLQRLFLHAQRISLPLVVAGKPLQFQASSPPPREFYAPR
jgi:tRNA pseudouridine65 synthase